MSEQHPVPAPALSGPDAGSSIATCLLSLLDSQVLSREYRQAMRQILERDKGLFEGDPGPTVALQARLAVAIFRSASEKSLSNQATNTEAAALLGAAVHLLNTAADVLDDVEDGDYQDATLAPPLALNASSGLLFLAQYALLSLPATLVSAARSGEIVCQFNLELVQICGAQHADLEHDVRLIERMSEEECLALTVGRSSAIQEACSTLAASLATQNQEVVHLFRAFGSKISLALLLQRDIHDILSPWSKQDLLGGKATLPLVYSLASSQYGPKLQQLLLELRELTQEQALIEQSLELIRKAGGIYYTWVQSQLFGIEAYDIIKQLERYCKIDPYIYQILELYRVRNEEIENVK